MATTHRPILDRILATVMRERSTVARTARAAVPVVELSRRPRARHRTINPDKTPIQPAPVAAAQRSTPAQVRAAARERVAAREDALYARLYTTTEGA